MIKAIYKIPSIKQTFLITEPPVDASGKHSQSSETVIKKESLEHILRWKDHINPKEVHRPTLQIISPEIFLEVIEKCTSKEAVLSNQPCYNPEDLGLLGMNLLKTPSDPIGSLETSKRLGFVPDEDIIEVFI